MGDDEPADLALMVERILLGKRGAEQGLWVSKPGVNVFTAGPLDLAFSSSFSQLGLYTAGEVDCNWSDFYNWVEVPFGKTFPGPPIVHMQQVISAGEYRSLSPVGSFFVNMLGGVAGAYHEVFAETSASAIRIRSARNGSAPDFRLRYTVMDYNL